MIPPCIATYFRVFPLISAYCFLTAERRRCAWGTPPLPRLASLHSGSHSGPPHTGNQQQSHSSTPPHTHTHKHTHIVTHTHRRSTTTPSCCIESSPRVTATPRTGGARAENARATLTQAIVLYLQAAGSFHSKYAMEKSRRCPCAPWQHAMLRHATRLACRSYCTHYHSRSSPCAVAGPLTAASVMHACLHLQQDPVLLCLCDPRLGRVRREEG